MSKEEYLNRLKQMLCDYPEEETARFISYYNEIIDDRIEDGSTEEQAVESLGSVEQVASNVKSEMPMVAIVKSNVRAKVNENKKKHGGNSTMMIVLLIVGFPIWLPLLIAVGAVVLSLFICLWSIVLAIWSVFVSLAAGSVAALVAGIASLFTGQIALGIYDLGAVFVLCALAIGFFWLSILLTKLSAKACAKSFRGIKKSMIKKQEEVT